MRAVLDASALLALLRGEAGAERVEAVLDAAVVGAVNLSEVVAKLVDDAVPEAEARAAIGRLDLDIRSFDGEQALIAGVLRRGTRDHGLSLGDRACLALAGRLDATAMTADRSWARLDLGIPVELIR